MKHTIQAGFTLIELLVVAGIITILSAVILANNNRFGGQVLLQNLAYDIALSVRQSQVYGISVARFGPSTFSAGYGMHFNMGYPTTYNLFADAVIKDGIYESSENVAPSPYSIGRGFSIQKLCAPQGTDSKTCLSVQDLEILFLRPEPDAYISASAAAGTPPTALTFDTNGAVVGGSPYDSARIVVSSPRGDSMSIIVSSNGQITVSNN